MSLADNIQVFLGFLCVLAATFFALALINWICLFKWNGRYVDFFESIAYSDSRKWMSLSVVPVYKLLCSFSGKNVGIRGEFGDETRIIGYYIEHISLFYWMFSPLLVMAFHPKELGSFTPSSLDVSIAFLILMSVNIISDCGSLLWTKYNISRIVKRENSSILYCVSVIVVDLIIASAFFLLTQFVSSCLYPVQVGFAKITDFSTMIEFGTSLETPFKLYVLGAGQGASSVPIEFWGQLIISASSYVPTFFLLLYCLLIFCLAPISRATTRLLVTFGTPEGYRVVGTEKFLTVLGIIIVPTFELAKLSIEFLS